DLHGDAPEAGGPVRDEAEALSVLRENGPCRDDRRLRRPALDFHRDVHLGLQQRHGVVHAPARLHGARGRVERVPDEVETPGKRTAGVGIRPERQAVARLDRSEVALGHVEKDPQSSRFAHDEERNRRVGPCFLARVCVALDDDSRDRRGQTEELVRPSRGICRRIASPSREPGRGPARLAAGAREVGVGRVEVLAGSRAALDEARDALFRALGGREVRGRPCRVGLSLAEVRRGDLREKVAGRAADADGRVEGGEAARERRKNADGRVLVPREAPRDGEWRGLLPGHELHFEGGELRRSGFERERVAHARGRREACGVRRALAASGEKAGGQKAREEAFRHGWFLSTPGRAATKSARAAARSPRAETAARRMSLALRSASRSSRNEAAPCSYAKRTASRTFWDFGRRSFTRRRARTRAVSRASRVAARSCWTRTRPRARSRLADSAATWAARIAPPLRVKTGSGKETPKPALFRWSGGCLSYCARSVGSGTRKAFWSARSASAFRTAASSAARSGRRAKRVSSMSGVTEELGGMISPGASRSSARATAGVLRSAPRARTAFAYARSACAASARKRPPAISICVFSDMEISPAASRSFASPAVFSNEAAVSRAMAALARATPAAV